ncbi:MULTISPECIES: EexN family lipoprotein [Stenotrophomonas]|uniref:EexN family lipoprotein n=1 Tax=Stenotrophomonas TaxID=40323 RepID=UPI000770606C|nr:MULTISPECIES: EexN family lipoprotein [Stenotrophomonas]AMJ56300.1 entry exclusion lipoprotein TrbK [Stenotrophomonas sp. KCTC 12332]
MKTAFAFALVVVLTGCGPEDRTEKKDVPSVEELASDPVRLKELRQQCRTGRATLGDMLCNRVAEATRKRFYGDGDTPYTPPKEPPKF